MEPQLIPQRADKWLWASRFFKTRALAQDAIESGRIRLLQGEEPQRIKSSRDLRPGDRLRIQRDNDEWTVTVLATCPQRGPAPFAQRLYEETAASRIARETQALERQLASEPSAERWGRPTKKDRRELERWHRSEH